MARKMVEPMASTAYRRRGVKIVVCRSLPILGEVLMKQNSLQDILALSTFSINASLWANGDQTIYIHISTYFQRWPCPPWCSEGGARGRCRKGRYWGESFVSNNAIIVFVPEEEGDWRREVDVVKVKLDLLSGDFPDEGCSGAAEGKNPDVEEHQEKHVFLRWRARWIWSFVSIIFVVIWHFYICARNSRFISWNRISSPGRYPIQPIPHLVLSVQYHAIMI